VVALRDSVDYNRNVIFYRTRDNCQTVTEKDPYLVLTGPSRAVMLLDPVTVEVVLKVKGATESEDKDFSFLAAPVMRRAVLSSCLFNTVFASKLSTLEFTLGHIVFSVEATISLEVVDGAWPDGFRGQFSARTCAVRISDTDDEEVFSHSEDKKVPVIGDGSYASSIDKQVVILLDSGVGRAPVIGDGKIKLSRCVASVEVEGKLIVSVKAWQIDNQVVEKETDFTPKEADRSQGMLDVGFCTMKVTVAWSLVSHDPEA